MSKKAMPNINRYRLKAFSRERKLRVLKDNAYES